MSGLSRSPGLKDKAAIAAMDRISISKGFSSEFPALAATFGAPARAPEVQGYDPDAPEMS